MVLRSEVDRLLANIQNEIKIDEAELSGLPDGRIAHEIHAGKTALVAVTYENGKRIRRTVKKDSEQAAAMIRKLVLSARLDELKNNEKALLKIISNIKETSHYSRFAALKQKFPYISDEQMLKAFYSANTKLDWSTQNYEQLTYKPEMKSHITSRGLRVRSKSELVIAETLYEYELMFRYEMVLHFDNTSLSPDFTIMRPDGKLFYWEHQGLTNSKEYRDRQIRKLQMYINNGIAPWDNLIITYDNAQGSLDTRIIRSEIENKLLASVSK